MSHVGTDEASTPVLPGLLPIPSGMKDLQAFPPSAAASLVSGYCTDFIELAANMAQTLEQVTMRGLDIGQSKEELARVEHGMRALADAIHETLGKVGAAVPSRTSSCNATASANTTAKQGASRVVPTSTTVRPAASTQRSDVTTADAVRATESKAAAASPAKAQARGPAPASATTLQGNTETLPMRSVFQFLSRTRKNGMLHVSLEQEKVRLQFVDGCLVGTSSTQAPANEGLGNVLAELGFVDSREVAPLVKQHGDGRQRLGSLLLQMGRITHEQLAQAVELQTSRRFERVLACKFATYEFHAESDHAEHGMRIRAASQPQPPTR